MLFGGSNAKYNTPNEQYNEKHQKKPSKSIASKEEKVVVLSLIPLRTNLTFLSQNWNLHIVHPSRSVSPCQGFGLRQPGTGTR